jgi:Fe-S-cluster formation regulator IscX/YfhJ
MWTDKLEIGDLLYSARDGKPAIILDKQETARAKYGDIDNKRLRFKLHIGGEQGWLDEVKLRTQYELP